MLPPPQVAPLAGVVAPVTALEPVLLLSVLGVVVFLALLMAMTR